MVVFGEGVDDRGRVVVEEEADWIWIINGESTSLGHKSRRAITEREEERREEKRERERVKSSKRCNGLGYIKGESFDDRTLKEKTEQIGRAHV